MKTVFLCCITLTLGLIQPISGLWWPSPESLLLFFPLDSHSGINDIAKAIQPTYIQSPLLETSKAGPFEIASSSYTVTADNHFISYYDNLPNFQSFTFSTYYYVSGRASRGGIAFSYHWDVLNRFSINYRGQSLEVYRFDVNGKYAAEKFTVDRVFTNGWTFFAITYDHNTQTFTVFGETGNPIHKQLNFPINDAADMRFHLGYARDLSDVLLMYVGDAIACTMVYTSVLSDYEISQLPNVCMLKGADPPTTTPTTTPPAPIPPVSPWPEPKHLLGLWPLSHNYKLFDIGKWDFRTVIFTNIC